MKDLSLHIMDIVQNSVSARAKRIETAIAADVKNDCLKITVSDNGAGMDADLLSRVTSPFATTRTTRKVGLGLPLFKESSEMAGGEFRISSVKNEGTQVSASFKISHIDRLPLGDVAETMAGVIMAYPQIQWVLVLSNDSEEFRLDTDEVKGQLGEVPITEYEVITWIKGYIDEGIRFIFGGVLNEVVS